MKSFNVLSRELDVWKNHLLEASAGTGKTFSIENIVVRLLIEGEEPCSLSQIAVMTFTRAATSDLKVRIRANIEKAIRGLRTEENLSDYLLHVVESGKAQEAIRRLDMALFGFDQAQIFTIHSFCSRMLREHLFEGDVGIEAVAGDDPLSNEALMDIIHDFFRTELRRDLVSPAQLKLVSTKGIDELKSQLLKNIKDGRKYANTTPYSEHLACFVALRDKFSLDKEKILADYQYLEPFFLKIDNTKGIENFAALFEKKEWGAQEFETLIKDGLVFVKSFCTSSLKKTNRSDPDSSKLNYPTLVEYLNQTLGKLVEEARSSSNIMSRLTHACQNFVNRRLFEEEKFRFDDFLQSMLKAITNPSFVNEVRKKYRAAIIDEFQDTDPIQWEIFRSLFYGHCALYLVGDPKQSIYAFRQADIYTYLSASKYLGKENHASLDTNFRSQPSLVAAMNALFKDSSAPGLITLPRSGEVLEYPEVKASSKIPELEVNDGFGSIHFFLADLADKKEKCDVEEELQFPFIAQEIQKLGLNPSQYAILVKSRYQAASMGKFLTEYGIPFSLQKCSMLTDSLALPAMKELLSAVLTPRDESSLKLAMGGPIIGWNLDQVMTLKESTVFEEILFKFYTLRQLLLEKGFAFFFTGLLQISFHPQNLTVGELMVSREDGDRLYAELHQVAELLMEHEAKTRASPDALLDYLDQFEMMAADEDEGLKVRRDPNQDAVQIVTIHASKGLEFDVVFALGLATPPTTKDEFYSIQDGIHQIRVPATDPTSEEYLGYLREMDEEKMRQLYVAMTRAKHRLYVPAIFRKKGKGIGFGQASAMELFLARLHGPYNRHEELYERINNQSSAILLDFINGLPPEIKIGYSLLDANSFRLQKTAPQAEVILQPPPKVDIPYVDEQMFSYTQLSKASAIIDLKGGAPHDAFSEIKTAHTLPSGAQTGIILHEIMEKLPLAKAASAQKPLDLHPLIRPYLDGTDLESWLEVVAEIIFNTLNSSLKGFRLIDIDPKKLYREMEFLYPYDKKTGYLKGVIDFAFEYDGRYYLADWKSNWLGPDSSFYGTEQLKAAMSAHDYYLQAKLYKEALRRFLALVDPRPFEECFGGMFYLFLRGMDPETPDRGVLFVGGEEC